MFIHHLMSTGMKAFTYILALVFSMNVFGQTRDTRAKLEIVGRINEISVSADEKIWLVTALGKAYFAEHIDSNWHYGPLFFAEDKILGAHHPHFDRISFFNKDTALLTGSIAANDSLWWKGNGYYRTLDGGKTWKLMNYGGNERIYTVYTDTLGNAWMAGSSQSLYYSHNFGNGWKEVQLPFSISDRIHSIYMNNALEGIAGGNYNQILVTKDNWKTSSPIETPFDQHKYSTTNSKFRTDGLSMDGIGDVFCWGNYYIVNQIGNYFYSDKQEIQWKKFPVDVVSVEIDNSTKKLIAICSDSLFVSFTTPFNYKYLGSYKIRSRGGGFKAVNSSLYFIDYINGEYLVYKITSDKVTKRHQYTTDSAISYPSIVQNGHALTWGVTGNQLYLSEDNGKNWYRENALDFSVTSIKLNNDSNAILWDGNKESYLYSLKEHKPSKYFYNKPLESFLQYPVVSFSIVSGFWNCYNHGDHSVEFTKSEDTILSSNDILKRRNKREDSEDYDKDVSYTELMKLLQSINDNPSQFPTIKDFTISESDKAKYYQDVDELINSKFTGVMAEEKSWYLSITDSIFIIDSSQLMNMFSFYIGYAGEWDTYESWFNVQIVNENKDTVNINVHGSSPACGLPWKVEYKNQYFNCYSLAFSKFIKNCIPDSFRDKDIFENKILLYSYANYLKRKK